MKLSNLEKKYQREISKKYQKMNDIQKEAAIQELAHCGFNEMYLRKNEEFLIRLWNDFIVPNR